MPKKKKQPEIISAYGEVWQTADIAQVEAHLYRNGGHVMVNGHKVGNGPVYHFKRLISELAPWFDWHFYANMIADAWVKHDTIGIMGPASSGKTFTAAMCAYAEFYTNPRGTSILMSSITLPGLRLRVWGALTDIVHKVKARRPNAPGCIVQSEYRIYPEEPTEEEMRDPRDAIMGVACRMGDTWVGISNFVGLKNDRLIGIFDEASLMPRSFWDATANLRKNPSKKFVALGNPKDPTDALGVICEPARDIGGWEGLTYSERSRTWKAVGPNSIALQLSGLDSPNFTKDGSIPFPYLITPAQLDEDKERYGVDSWQYQMMDLGVMPKNPSARRVITRAICERGNAFGEAIWDGSDNTTDYVGIDAAYSGVGGDRTALIKITVGNDLHGSPIIAVTEGPILISVEMNKRDPDGKLIPAEDQIAQFVKDYCTARAIKPQQVGFDSTGRGSLVSSFAKLWSPHVIAIEYGGSPPDGRTVYAHDDKLERDAYGKMVSALWFAWRNAIISGQIRQLPTSVFEEGTYREYIITKHGKEDVEPKEDTIKRLGRSPDLADAMVAAIEVARRNGFMVGRDLAKKELTQPKWLEERRAIFRRILDRERLVNA